jgi:hypothetical protein
MIGMVRDTWRAVLVVVTVVLLREIIAERPAAAPPAVTTVWQPPAWQPAAQKPDRPLRRVAAALTELGDSVIGVVRR